MLERRQKLPEWATNSPELGVIEGFYWDAFHELNTCRPVGLGLGEIPWTAIVQYAEYYDLEEYLSDLFLQVIRDMDRTYLQIMNKKLAKKNG